MKLRFLVITLLLVLVFASVSSVSALATTGKPVEKDDFSIEGSHVIEPQNFAAYQAIANAARLVNAVGKALSKGAKFGAGSFSAGYLAAAGADAYSKTTGSSLNNKSVPVNAEVVFD